VNNSLKLLKLTKKSILKTLEAGSWFLKENHQPEKGKSVWPRTLGVINGTTQNDHFLIPSVAKEDAEMPCCSFSSCW